ncbi:hypothetical protein [Streptomyces sp. NPDC002067]
MSTRRFLRGITASLVAVRNFRLFTLGQLGSVTGTWMMFTVQDRLVLCLSGDSAQTLGLVTAGQFVPYCCWPCWAAGSPIATTSVPC